ncbi:MAG TPA: methylmalonyl-CoA epimerase [Trueperaceae bacterium]|nr:methylmalonyl-CoA epimerase [Trueperaceae bacterium]
MSAAPPLPAALEGLALGRLALDHVAIAVEDLDAAGAAYATLGLQPAGADETVADQGVRVRALSLGDTVLELMTPLGPGGPVARFLERRGPGLHHIALRVADLDTLLARLQGQGARLIDTRPRAGRAGSRIAFVHPAFTGGVLIELVEPAA